MTPIRSLGLATELALAVTRGTVEDRGDYLVVRTPDDPGYYYGNLLVLPAAPQVGEVAFWSRRFADALGADPAIRHVTLAWDGTTGDTGAADELVAAGFRLDVTQTMSASYVAPASRSPLPLCELAAAEMTRVADLTWEMGDRHDEDFRAFLHRRARWHGDLIARGDARFWAAHDGDALVASLGIVSLPTGTARYQDVQTAVAYRGRGLAAAMLAAAAHDAFARGATRAVIVAEPESIAARIYARAGFQVVERTASACRYPLAVTEASARA